MTTLGRFFGNLMFGEQNELKSRYLLVGLNESEKQMIKEWSQDNQEKVVRKRLSEKGCQKTSDRLVSLLKGYPALTQEGMAKAIGISRQAIQKHLRNLKASGRIRRVGPDKGGHWEVIEKE